MQCEETADTQEWRIMKFKTEGDKQFTGDWRIAAITVDMVPIATIVAEMIKKILQAKVHEATKCSRYLGTIRAGIL